jgi:hypothetical protein
MGTRHLIAVQLDGQYRIAQYGQWDGYPSGQGETVLKFLQQVNRPIFEAKLRAASFLTEADFDAINAKIKAEQLDWPEVWPELSRNTGAEILEMVERHDAGIKLNNQIGFAANSLMCEWGYVVDLDANTLEVFKGFQKEPLPETDRFAGIDAAHDAEVVEGYYPIRRVASYRLAELPTVEQMVKDCEPSDEENEDE